MRYSVDDDPFEVTPRVVESIKSSNKSSDKKVILPDPASSYVEQEDSVTATGVGDDVDTGTGIRRRVGLTMSEEVDELIDHCIEIESNKRMIKENVRWFPLTFKSKNMELKVLFINSSIVWIINFIVCVWRLNYFCDYYCIIINQSLIFNCILLAVSQHKRLRFQV